MACVYARQSFRLLAFALAAGALGILAGCGGQTKTVSVSGPPPVARGASAAAGAQDRQGASSEPTTGASGPSGPPAGAQPSSRTATEPAFTHAEAQAEGLGQALAVLHERGYSPVESSQYHAAQTLRVLVGAKPGSGAGFDQQAFFFLGGRFIGTDTKEASATIEVLEQGQTEVTLGYALYRTADGSTSPTGTHATVRFQLNDGKLTALDPIPPARSSSALSRL